LTGVLPFSRSDSRGLAAFLTSLADLITDPLALGEEALRCLVSTAWITSGSVVETLDGESHTLVSFGPQTQRQSSEALAGSVPPDYIQVRLGSKQSRRYALYVSPQDSDHAAASLYGVTRLLASLSRPDLRESRSATPSESVQVPRQTADDEGLFRSPATLALLDSAKRVAPLDITVLLTGESGTGKEIVANIIHRASGAPRDAFVAFNCATVPRDMVDSQLFGYRRGAFTGAVQGFKGVISAADGGTPRVQGCHQRGRWWHAPPGRSWRTPIRDAAKATSIHGFWRSPCAWGGRSEKTPSESDRSDQCRP